MNTITITQKQNNTFALALLTDKGNIVCKATAKTEADLTKAIARLKTSAGLMPASEVKTFRQ